MVKVKSLTEFDWAVSEDSINSAINDIYSEFSKAKIISVQHSAVGPNNETSSEIYILIVYDDGKLNENLYA